MQATFTTKKGVTLATSANVNLQAVAAAANAVPVTVVPPKATKGAKGVAKRQAAIAKANGLTAGQHNAHCLAYAAQQPAPVAAPAPVAVTVAPAAAPAAASKVAQRSPGNAAILAYLATYAATQAAKAPNGKCGWHLYAGLTPAAVLAVVGNNCPTQRCARRKMRAHLKALAAAAQ